MRQIEGGGMAKWGCGVPSWLVGATAMAPSDGPGAAIRLCDVTYMALLPGGPKAGIVGAWPAP